MSRIPLIQLSERNFDQMMSDLALVERDSFLSELVSLVLGPDNNPDYVVEGAYDETKWCKCQYFLVSHFPQRVRGEGGGHFDLHGDTRNHICSIPEADITAKATTIWWVPRHDKEVQVDEDADDNQDVPSAELAMAQPQPVTLAADKEQANRHRKGERSSGIAVQIDDCKNLRQHQYLFKTAKRGKVTPGGQWMDYLPKLKTSPAGGAAIMSTVAAHLSAYGPRGVPKGLVDTQKPGYGRTPCLYHESQTHG